MSPSIRVDDDVYSFLKQHAEPFVDTPNTVLRRMLGIEEPRELDEEEAPSAPRQRGKSSKAARRGSKARRRRSTEPMLPIDAYIGPLLAVLSRHQGEASARDVIGEVGEALRENFTEADLDAIASGETRWKSRVQFARLKMRDEGLIDPSAARGVWRLTEQGMAKAKAIAS